MLYLVAIILVILLSFDMATSYEVGGTFFVIAGIKIVVSFIGARFVH